MSDSRDEFDRLLDTALGTYGDPGADSMLAERVLDRIAAENAPARRRRWLVWAIALPVAACVVMAVLLLPTRPSELSSGGQEEARNAQQPTSRAAQPAAQPARPAAPVERAGGASKQRHRRAGLATRSVRLPKQPIFPMPKPLSPAEMALVNFAARATRSERESLLTAHEGLNAPLHFAEVHIEPIELPAEGTIN